MIKFTDPSFVGPPKEPDPDAASLTISEITFSDGTQVTLSPNDIVVLVGPNNAGKSALLREIGRWVPGGGGPLRQVSTDAKLRPIGNDRDVRERLQKFGTVFERGGTTVVRGHGFNIEAYSGLENLPMTSLPLQGVFHRAIRTKDRITGSDPATSFDALSKGPNTPIQLAYFDSDIESRISRHFRKAFGQDLIVMRVGGNKIPLLVGQRPTLDPGEDPTRRSYLGKLAASTKALQEQGDGMRSFATVILETLAGQSPTIITLDEPEAFLHPPQAHLLGELLARERRPLTQLFVATHSPDVLAGFLKEAPEQLRLLRIHRSGDVNQVKELPKDKVKAVAADPLMKYSPVLSGVFHQRTIICEADADCMFYQSLLALPSVSTETHPDVLFVHANGKHRMAAMAEALKALAVPVDVIADFDVLSEKSTFQNLVVTLGGDWSAIETDWNTVKSAIESRKPWLNADALISEITKKLDAAAGKPEFPKKTSVEIRNVLKMDSPWAAAKSTGDAAIPNGQPTQAMGRLRDYLEHIGLWIVPVGELEGFYRSAGKHGPKWLQTVMEECDLDTEPDLEQAREFVRSVWARPIS
ncbi:hypothetical protein BN1012_Phect2583 [Candidatus Phaeomarinobacter ectocarpi]|uniref:AAA+ ATPase domain-containing protein n=1 Tax=Candidatus Phaeomarinibacter ectocarpi TaxID=1458461 RepID=X5MP24_9HYPH|nr:AAA family ATPase [Candidatus Phaeomarinobacter ectocarpi]CDO60796.1 hypothetical protein BN1012_Phect2583 [Candidatus Phaeomarinobacter ectocarpi]